MVGVMCFIKCMGRLKLWLELGSSSNVRAMARLSFRIIVRRGDVYANSKDSGTGARPRVRVFYSVSSTKRICLCLVSGFGCDVRESLRFRFIFKLKHGCRSWCH